MDNFHNIKQYNYHSQCSYNLPVYVYLNNVVARNIPCEQP